MPENRIKPVTNVLENAYTLLHLSWSCVGYNTIIVNHVHSIGQPTGSKPNALRSAPFKTICLVYFSNTRSFRRVPHFIEGLSCQTSQHFIRHATCVHSQIGSNIYPGRSCQVPFGTQGSTFFVTLTLDFCYANWLITFLVLQVMIILRHVTYRFYNILINVYTSFCDFGS